MTIKLPTAALAVLAMLASGAAQAAPMRCSGQQDLCIAACNKAAAATRSACITACGQRQAVCVKTGCWDNKVQTFCGLLRQ